MFPIPKKVNKISKHNKSFKNVFSLIMVETLNQKNKTDFPIAIWRNDETITKYLEMFKNILSHTESIGHYNMMMGIGEEIEV